MSQFAAHSLPIRQLFANPFLAEAPPYQRAFAWTRAEAGRLLDDVWLAIDADGDDHADYFLGTMLFIDRDSPPLPRPGWPLVGAPRAFEVVDGLQRLTTLTILFCVLRDLDAEAGAPPSERLLATLQAGDETAGRFWLSLRGADQKFLQASVRAPGATQAPLPEQEGLPSAHKRILEVREHFVAALADLDVAQRRRLADFLLDECYVVLIATTGIDRAYRMFMVLNDSGKELARNDILKASLLGSVPDVALPRATAVWDSMEGGLDSDFEGLFSHVRAMRGRPGAHVVAGIRAIAAESGGAETFIERVLRPAAAVFDDIRKGRHAGSPRSTEIARTLGYLNWLPASDWVAPAMLWWLEKGADAGELAWFLSGLDRLAYGLGILGLGSSRRANRMGAVIAAIRNREDMRGANSPLALTRNELRSIHYNLRDLHVRSTPMTKLVLLRLNDVLAGKPQHLPIEVTVEHVLPRKPGGNSQWRGWFPDPAAREVYTECLGNLVLVTKAQNDKAGNLDFAHKKDVLFKTAGAPLPMINDYVRRQREWKAGQIEMREAELMRLLDALWKVGEPPKGAEVAPRGRRRPQAAE